MQKKFWRSQYVWLFPSCTSLSPLLSSWLYSAEILCITYKLLLKTSGSWGTDNNGKYYSILVNVYHMVWADVLQVHLCVNFSFLVFLENLISSDFCCSESIQAICSGWIHWWLFCGCCAIPLAGSGQILFLASIPNTTTDKCREEVWDAWRIMDKMLHESVSFIW